MVYRLVLLSVLLASFCVGSAFAEPADLDSLRSQVAEVQQAYVSWSLTASRKIWRSVKQGPEFSFDAFSWDQAANYRSNETITVVGDKFRFERRLPTAEECIFSFDGQMARGRNFKNVGNASNGSFDFVAMRGYTLLMSDLPHTLPAGLYYPPDLSWLFGAYRYDSRRANRIRSKRGKGFYQYTAARKC